MSESNNKENKMIKMLSVQNESYINVQSLITMGEFMQNQFANTDKDKFNIEEEFVIGCMAGVDYFLNRIREQSDKFFVELELNSIGMNDVPIKKIDIDMKTLKDIEKKVE